MRILAISVYYKPIRPGYGTRTPEIIIDSAARLGHNIVLYTGTVPDDMITEEKFQKKKCMESLGSGTIQTHRLRIPTSGHHKPYRRSIIYTIFIIRCFFKMLFERNLDAVMGISPFPPFFIPLELLAKIRGLKFYMHQGDLFPDTVIDFNLTKSSAVVGFLRSTSIMSFKLADLIGVNNHATKIGMQKYPINHDKVVFIELAIDTDVFRPLPVQKNGRFTVLYNGVFGPAYDFDLMLDAAKELESYDIDFIIAGRGELKGYIEEGIRKRSLRNVRIHEPVKETSDLIDRLNKCDAAMVSLVPAEVSKTPHPSKIFEYMACGKPVVCAGSGALDNLFKRAEAGYIVKPGDLKGFTSAILKLYGDRMLCEEMGSNARKYVVENHSMQVYMKNLDDIISGLEDR